MIFKEFDKLVEHLNHRRVNDEMPLAVIATCGGFDPVHVGHVRCFKESAEMKYQFENIVNGDEFLQNKKGFVFMPEEERMEIIRAMSGVDYVTRWYDGTQNCIEALRKISPNIFTKGGDRDSRDRIPESDVCDEVGCKIVFGVGGTDKPQSSSWLTSKLK